MRSAVLPTRGAPKGGLPSATAGARRRQGRWRGALLGLLLGAAAGAAHADAIERLRGFLADTRTLRADFSQTVLPQGGRKAQFSSGSMAVARPGKFRWQIERPYPQLIVGDGKKIWLHDPDLNQVTVKPQASALAGSPAALFAGADLTELEKYFTFSAEGEKDGLDWLAARPLNVEAGFTAIRIGFAGNLPRTMELTDSFGQQTALLFTNFAKNPPLPAATFTFTPPAGADVLGD